MNYSVPYEYIKQQVEIRLTRCTVEVFFGGTRIASHPRLLGRPNQYSTNESHMPLEHQEYLQWNGDRFLRWAKQIGPNTTTVVKLFLSAYKVEQQGYKSCMALQKSTDKYSSVRLEATVKRRLKSKPSIEEFLYICEYLNVTPSDFFDETKTEPIFIQKALDGMRLLSDKDLLSLTSLVDRLEGK